MRQSGTVWETRLGRVLDERGWDYPQFRREFERAGASMGVSVSVGRATLNRWERGQGHPRRESRAVLERLFGEPVTTLLASYTVAPTPSEPLQRTPAPFRTAVAIIVHDGQMLMTRRPERLGGVFDWVPPAGAVKPGEDAAKAAVREVREETGVEIRVLDCLGEQVHPLAPNGALLIYYWCEYLAGRPANLTPRENLAVEWVPVHRLHRLMDLEHVYPPVRELLGLNGGKP